MGGLPILNKVISLERRHDDSSKAEDRTQVTLLPESLDDYVADDNPVRVIDVFVDRIGSA